MSGPVVHGKQPFAGSLRAGHARPLPVHYYQEYYHYGQTQ